jgi:hypothetical protein
MAKGYWLAQVDVTNSDGYRDYITANQIAFRKYGGRYVVRAGRYTKPSRAPAAPAWSSSSFPTTTPPSRAIARRNTSTPSACERTTQRRMSRLSKDMMASSLSTALRVV